MNGGVRYVLFGWSLYGSCCGLLIYHLNLSWSSTSKLNREFWNGFCYPFIITFTAEKSFPYVKKRIQVKDRKDVDLSPIEVAIEEMTNKVRDLDIEVTSPEPDIKKLQLKLQGQYKVTVFCLHCDWCVVSCVHVLMLPSGTRTLGVFAFLGLHLLLFPYQPIHSRNGSLWLSFVFFNMAEHISLPRNRMKLVWLCFCWVLYMCPW